MTRELAPREAVFIINNSSWLTWAGYYFVAWSSSLTWAQQKNCAVIGLGTIYDPLLDRQRECVKRKQTILKRMNL